jgi:glycosyltransferase involved in cell wall biosynthesis
MDILAVTDHLGNVGGADLSARTVISGLAEHSAVGQVTVVGIERPDVQPLEFGDAEVIGIDPPNVSWQLPGLAGDLVLERLLARAVRRRLGEADIVHAHHRRSTLSLTHIDAPCPTVSTVRDYWPTCPISIYHVDGDPCSGCEDRLNDCVRANDWDGLEEPGVKGYLLAKRLHQQSTIQKVDTAVFIADHLQERLRPSVAFPNRTEVIYNPVSIEDDIEPRETDGPTFVTASSLSESKGVETAVRAMGEIIENHPEARLIVFGNGPERDRLSHVAAESAPGAVQFRGRVSTSEVYRTIKGATATVFPSLWDEPFGRVTVESMALGTPVVGSDVGGIAEVVDHGKSGLLFTPGDAESLAAALCLLIEDGSVRSDLSETGKRHATRFTPKRIVEEHVSLYQSLMR